MTHELLDNQSDDNENYSQVKNTCMHANIDQKGILGIFFSSFILLQIAVLFVWPGV